MEKILVNVGVTIQDPDTSEILIHTNGSRIIGSGCVHDQEANTLRLAEQTNVRAFAKLRDRIAGQGDDKQILLLDLVKADRDAIIAAWLREKAKELVGYTLYHPEHSLTAWAAELSPTPEELAERYNQPREPLAAPVESPLTAEYAAAHGKAWPNQMTREHCQAVEFYGKSRLAKPATHVVCDFRPTGGSLVVYRNEIGKPPAAVVFAGSETDCTKYARINNATDPRPEAEPRS
jgi:hypothetical protein